MKRIFIAFLISVVGIVLSWQYLRPKEWSSSITKDRKVVARVVNLLNDVNRQESGRLLWSPVRKGDDIYLNDKIKTSGLSSVILQLTNTASKLEVEENTMIIMAQGEKKLALEMLEGRVFIQQAEENVDLLSGGKKLDVSGNASVSVNKNGESQVESFGISQENFFSELTPVYSADILSLNNTQEVKWKISAGAGEVEVLTGESPLLLKKIEGLKANVTSGSLKVPFRPGLNYWQIVSGEKKSPLMKLNLIRPIPPTPLFPAEKELIKVADRPFDFKWIKGNAGDLVKVEVAKDSSFNQILLSEEVKDQTFFAPASGLTPGEYFWRVRSKISDTEWMDSKAISFLVHLGSNFLSPTPIYPADQAVFYLGKIPSNNVRFEWRKSDSALFYDLIIVGEGIKKDAHTPENSALVNINKIGRYTWEVHAEGQNGTKSVLPVKRTFEVRESGTINWSMAQKEFHYLDSLPIIILKWDKRYTGPSMLKISAHQDMRDSENFQVQGRDFPYRVQKDGVYYAKVLGLDEAGAVAAESDSFEFTVKAAPLPPVPIFAGEKILKATPQGELRAQITNAQEKWLIVVSITDSAGRVVDERRFNDPRLTFNGLMPGRYVLLAKFQDEYRRSGEMSERIEVEVPEKSMIAAPKLKGIKVR